MRGRPTAAAAGKTDVGGDLTVNRLGFGAMRITDPGIWGEPPDRNRAKAALRRAVELDVNFIDTADSYGPEVSERLITETLYPYPDDLVIATKGGLVRPGPGCGSLTAARSTCTGRARAAWPGCAWTGSTCTSSTGRTRRCPLRSRSARLPS
jgi:aryl-alcohol dehydrogenase-like predicted oxidoreductase